MSMARNFLIPFLGVLLLIGFYVYLPESLKEFIGGDNKEL